jgi:PIN domain nuclease of toxin-antitoxin system
VKVLIDTHVLLWWAAEPQRLSTRAREVLDDSRNELVWSVIGTWEIALKVSRGKIKLPEPLHQYLEPRLARAGIQQLPVHSQHALALLDLPGHHWDPFDRMLIAQARVEGLAILTADRDIPKYEVEAIW